MRTTAACASATCRPTLLTIPHPTRAAPTPIALPGVAALQAAINPAPTSALYFVAKGDGTSVFSDTLGDHNKAVDKYIRGQ